MRADLATVVRRAGAGERTVITVAGRAVAQLGPLDSSTTDAPVALVDLVARGLVHAPRRTGLWSPPDPVRVWSTTRIDRLLREIR
jgi:antitoxin (DNA-binding transcriptional repressor) of toxin-antitoxin stability system